MKKQPRIGISKPVPEDFHELVAMIYGYKSEPFQTTKSGVPVDHDVTCDTVWTMINGDLDTFIAFDVDTDEIVGSGTICYSHSFFTRPDACVEFFYVRPDYRGTKASRGILGHLVSAAKKRNANFIYSSADSGISTKNDLLFVNLHKKFGFQRLGTGLLLDISGE